MLVHKMECPVKFSENSVKFSSQPRTQLVSGGADTAGVRGTPHKSLKNNRKKNAPSYDLRRRVSGAVLRCRDSGTVLLQLGPASADLSAGWAGPASAAAARSDDVDEDRTEDLGEGERSEPSPRSRRSGRYRRGRGEASAPAQTRVRAAHSA